MQLEALPKAGFIDPIILHTAKSSLASLTLTSHVPTISSRKVPTIIYPFDDHRSSQNTSTGWAPKAPKLWIFHRWVNGLLEICLCCFWVSEMTSSLETEHLSFHSSCWATRKPITWLDYSNCVTFNPCDQMEVRTHPNHVIRLPLILPKLTSWNVGRRSLALVEMHGLVCMRGRYWCVSRNVDGGDCRVMWRWYEETEGTVVIRSVQGF